MPVSIPPYRFLFLGFQAHICHSENCRYPHDRNSNTDNGKAVFLLMDFCIYGNVVPANSVRLIFPLNKQDQASYSQAAKGM